VAGSASVDRGTSAVRSHARTHTGAPSMTSIPITHQIACVLREIGKREDVYPRWVRQGRMTQKFADEQLDAMRAVLATLQSIEAGQRLI
jgi:hypothetical protein